MRLSRHLLLVIDTETTGTDPSESRVVEIGGCYFRGGRRVGATMRVLIDPGVPIPREASAVHGIYDEHVVGCPSFANVAPRLFERLAAGRERPIVVGYNARHFDGPLLNAELVRVGRDGAIDLDTIIDPIVWARWWHREIDNKLASMCEHYGVQLRNAHAAWADAAATGELLNAMVQRRVVPDDYDDAMVDQAQLEARQRDEYGRWSHYLFADRHDERTVRIGFGKHRGLPIDEVPRSYLQFVLQRFDGVPDVVRDIFARHAA